MRGGERRDPGTLGTDPACGPGGPATEYRPGSGGARKGGSATRECRHVRSRAYSSPNRSPILRKSPTATSPRKLGVGLRAFELFVSCPELVTPGNVRSAVSRAPFPNGSQAGLNDGHETHV